MKSSIKHNKNKLAIVVSLIILAFGSTIVYGALQPQTLTNPTQLYTPLLNDSTEQVSLNIEQKIAALEKTVARTKRVESLLAYLKKVNSPIATQHYAELIVDLSTANNADYRVIVAIIGTESGFCKKPLNYNCFGYLNGVKYDSFDTAFNNLIPKISKQYVNKYGWDFAAFADAYGQMNDHAAGNLYSIASKLFY